MRIGGDLQSPAGQTNVIDYTTFSTIGDFIDFGDLSADSEGIGGICASPTRSCRMGSKAGPAAVNTIDYVTTSTLGNSIDFGDLTVGRYYLSACASPTRGVWLGGWNPTRLNTMDYVQIMTTGNAVDFGDATIEANATTSGISNGHGGL